MDTFADSLSKQIQSQQGFWVDYEAISSGVINRLLHSKPSVANQRVDHEAAISRLLQSASVFSQTEPESNKALAQDIALFSALASQNSESRTCAQDILVDVGNHPGAEELLHHVAVGPRPFGDQLRNVLLRSLNTVPIAGRSRVLTDFQHRVWSILPTSQATAVSAPTSAGKSFVVMEYLCQQAIAATELTVVFLAPTRALLSEIHGKLDERLREFSESTRVTTIPTIDPDSKPKQIFVLTQERLQVLLAIWDGTFDLVIVDEAQAIGDDSRGMILQDCLETVRSRSALTRFLFLAPGATGFSSLEEAINVRNITVADTELSSVMQNRITVDVFPGDEKRLELTLLANNRIIRVGSYSAERGFGHAQSRLAGVALELGTMGGSLVYGTGPAEAERIGSQIASDLPESSSLPLKELSEFIGEHVHKKYSLTRHVLKGVGFHYGKMPSLLREALEEAFKAGHLKYLVCTTTLFQGVNLPARNVFIDTPTRGKGADLDAAAIWNFAGRAGRLGKDIVGNVFLVGYNSWETRPLTERARFAIKPAFRHTVGASRAAILSILRNEPKEEKPFTPYSPIDAAAGLLISRAARGTLDTFIERTLGDSVGMTEKAELIAVANDCFASLNLPRQAVAINWTVNPFGQARLLARFRKIIAEDGGSSLIPLHPSEDAYQRYVKIFSRINKYILGLPPYPKYANLLTSTALAWMRGKPLPQIIEEKINFAKKTGETAVNIDAKVRQVFDFVEDILRFKYVQLGRAYVDLLSYAFKEAGRTNEARSIYDFPLALELGVATAAGQAFIELGLSRISAATLEPLIPDSKASVERARQWLGGLNYGDFKLSRVIWDELSRKGLVVTAPERMTSGASGEV